MNKFLLSLFSVLSFAFPALADEVDPIGSDAWKSLVVTVNQLDKRALPNRFESKIYFSFGDKSTSFLTSSITDQGSATKKLTIPKAATGRYQVYFMGNGNYDLKLAEGAVEAGVKNVEIRLKRIDVHHMVVTRDDGSTYVTTDGWARISTGSLGYQTETGKGMDLPVGRKYDIYVEADTEDGEDSYSAVLDFTNSKYLD